MKWNHTHQSDSDIHRALGCYSETPSTDNRYLHKNADSLHDVLVPWLDVLLI